MKIIDRSSDLAQHTVELLRRYSNRDDLLKSLVSVLERIHEEPLTEEEEAQLVSADGSTLRAWQVTDRLSTAGIKALVASYLAGSTIRVLAERYGISTSSVKRLLREHGARKQCPRARRKVVFAGQHAVGVPAPVDRSRA